MKLRILIGMILFSALLGAGNNIVNSNRVSWLGSAEVLPKPEGWPSLTPSQGIAAGLRVARQDVTRHWAIVLLALVSLAAMIRAASHFHRPVAGGIISWLRIALGLMFLIAAYPKFSDPEAFALLVTQYQLLPVFAVNLFSVMMPAFEITTGLALLLTSFEKEASAALLIMLLMFIVALWQALARNLGVACGCFDIEGAADAGETWFSLLRDVVLLIPVTWMFLKARRRFITGFLRESLE